MTQTDFEIRCSKVKGQTGQKNLLPAQYLETSLRDRYRTFVRPKESMTPIDYEVKGQTGCSNIFLRTFCLTDIKLRTLVHLKE
jgi:hypothetical protein